MKNFLLLIQTVSFYALIVLGAQFLTGCASSPDWRENHYQNINSGQQCKILCETGQLNKAIEVGCTCTNAKRHNNVSNSSSSGNVNNVYIGSSYGGYRSPRPQNGPDYSGFTELFKTLYDQEVRNREHNNNFRQGN